VRGLAENDSKVEAHGPFFPDAELEGVFFQATVLRLAWATGVQPVRRGPSARADPSVSGRAESPLQQHKLA